MARKDYDSRFELSSAQFKMLTQPDGYHEFGGMLEVLGEEYTEKYDSSREYKDPIGNWYIDGVRATEILGRLWVGAFETEVKAWAKRQGIDAEQFQIEYRSMYHPKEYNYRGDSVDFNITIKPRLYDKLCKEAIATEGFIEWLHKTYRSYDGFMSFYPDNLEEFIETMNSDYGKAVVIALSWWVFENALDDHADSLDGEFYRAADEVEWFSQAEFHFEPETEHGYTCDMCGEVGYCVSIGYDRYGCDKCVRKLTHFGFPVVCLDCAQEIDREDYAYSVGNGHDVCRSCFEKFRTEEWDDGFEPQKEELGL